MGVGGSGLRDQIRLVSLTGCSGAFTLKWEVEAGGRREWLDERSLQVKVEEGDRCGCAAQGTGAGGRSEVSAEEKAKGGQILALG